MITPLITLSLNLGQPPINFMFMKAQLCPTWPFITLAAGMCERFSLIWPKGSISQQNFEILLTSALSGFRKGHSTDTCLINLMDYIHKGISEGDYVVTCGVPQGNDNPPAYNEVISQLHQFPRVDRGPEIPLQGE
ncbi:unnamed protein product, partial [Meganyctiphanes norvegica]